MSIATLKRKTQAKYNNSSVGQNNFSLNGTHRSQGWVGQSMLSRSLPSTPMKGTTPKGNGGCCGTYNTKQGIIQSGVSSLNDNNVVKVSVIDNKGMLEEKNTPYRNYLMPYPYVSSTPSQHATCTVVKPKHLHDAGFRTEKLAASTSAGVATIENNQKYSCCANYNPYYRRKIFNFVTVPTNSGNGSLIRQNVQDNVNLIKGARLLCDDYITARPDQYDEINFKKGIQYDDYGNYMMASNPSNGGVLPGP